MRLWDTISVAMESDRDPPFQKTFTPTIPTTRRVKRDVSPSASLPDKKKQEDSPQSRRKTQDKRGRGRDRKRGKEVITSASVFSMGPAERTMERKRGVTIACCLI